MSPHASGIDALHQAGVLVNQPRFPQHVRRGVLQLQQSGQRLSFKHPEHLNPSPMSNGLSNHINILSEIYPRRTRGFEKFFKAATLDDEEIIYYVLRAR